ncbi:MAG TPA: hypothetical protein IAC31_00445 [Candidatus Faecousia intestinigallinarum]|nr:hypothetical protein [Candidatus Faecousia intestinigallinarum]
MFRKEVERYPLWAWIFTAVSAPAARLAGRGPWLPVLLLAAGCCLLCWGLHRLAPDEPRFGKLYCLAQFLFLIPVAGEMIRMSQDCWPTGVSFPLVPATLALLAAANAWNGAERASRVGGILFWLLALLYSLVLLSGLKDIESSWLAPQMSLPSGGLPLILLLPAAALLLRRSGSRKAEQLGLGLIFLFTAAAALLTVGNLSPRVAAAAGDPFYIFSKSLRFLGVAERFEALVSVALTMSYFALLSLLFSIAGNLAETIRPDWGKAGVLICSVGGVGLLLAPPMPGGVLSAGALFLWAGLPLAYWGVLKKGEKKEKST